MRTPKFQRRREARPDEIAAAALTVFSEKGFAAARLDEIAARAGLSKGALYLYYENKEDLFHAVVRSAVLPNLEQARAMAAAYEGPFEAFIGGFAQMFAHMAETAPVGSLAKMVIGESRNFPELARFWHDEVVVPMLGVLCGLIERAQARGEVRPGEPTLYALQLVGPFLMGVLWRETFTPVGGAAIDLKALAAQHVRTLARGMVIPPGSAP